MIAGVTEMEDEEYLKQFMYLDLTIKIEWDKLPKCLQTDFGILKEYYDKNDVALFSSYEESTESTIKMCVLNGSIDRATGIKLFNVLGIYND